MSNYRSWDLYSLGKRALEWRERVRQAETSHQRRSYEGELVVIAREFNARFFTGPYFPPGFVFRDGKRSDRGNSAVSNQDSKPKEDA